MAPLDLPLSDRARVIELMPAAKEPICLNIVKELKKSEPKIMDWELGMFLGSGWTSM